MKREMKSPATRAIIPPITHKLLFAVLLLVVFFTSVPKMTFANNTDFTSTQLRLAGSGVDSVKVIISTSDGGFIASVLTTSKDGDFSGLGAITQAAASVLVKYDSNKNIIWKKLFDGFSIKGIYQIDTGYIAVGENFSGQAIIAKVDSSGLLVWKKEFGGSAVDTFAGLTVKNNSAIYVIGSSESRNVDLLNLNKGGNDAILIKYDMNGNKVWTRTFGGASDDAFYAIQVIKDGRLVAVGESLSEDGDMASVQSNTGAAIAILYDDNGNVLKKNRFGGYSYETFNAVSRTEDGGFIAAGESSSSDGDLSGYQTGISGGALLVKYDSSGTKQWIKLIDGENKDAFNSITQSKTGNYITVGRSGSTTGSFQGLNAGRTDGVIAEIDDKGNLMRLGTEGGQGQEYFYTGAILKDDNTYVTGGDTSSGLDKSYLGKSAMDGFIHVYDFTIKNEIVEFLSDNIEITNKDVKVNINYPASSTAKQYKIGAQGAWTTYTAPVVMTENNTLFARFMNSSGIQSQEYSHFVNNIDKTPPIPPNFKPNISEPTSSNVSMVIEYPNENIKEYRLNGGPWTAYTTPVLFTANGTIEARAIDIAGNIGANTYIVSNIDKIAPKDPTFKPDITKLTNTDVILTIVFDTDGWLNEYKIDSGGWNNYVSQPLQITKNSTVYARSMDKAGNKSNTTVYTINNIDKLSPIEAIFTADNTKITNSNVTVSISYPSDAYIKQFYGGGVNTWTNYVAPVVTTQNGNVYARSIDEAGNISKEAIYYVNNIDKTPPSKPIITAERTKPTENIVIMKITYSESDAVKEYRKDNGLWTLYDNPLEFKNDGTLEARITDLAGNTTVSAIYSVRIRPTVPNVSANVTAPTNGNVKITINYSSEIITKQYQIDNGVWVPYTSPIEITKNSALKARGIDSYGYVSSEATYLVSNIDKTPPIKPDISSGTMNLPTDQDVVLTINYPSDAIKKEYSKNSGPWVIYTEPIVFSENGELIARGTDGVGNISDISKFSVKNIDKVPPPKPVILPSTTKPTNKDVSINIEYSSGSHLLFQVNNGDWLSPNSYNMPIIIKENGTVRAKAIKNSGATSEISVYEVTNIDRIPLAEKVVVKVTPTTLTQTGVIVTMTYPNTQEKVEIYYQLGTDTTQEWKLYTNPINITSNTVIRAKAIDEAGNSNRFYTETNITNIVSKTAIYTYSSGKLYYVTLSTGEKYRYVYDNNGNLVSVELVQP